MRAVRLAAVLLLALLVDPGAATSGSQGEPFATWLDGLRQEALARGVSPRTVNTALADVSLLPRVVELDRHQPEVRLTFDRYVARVITPARIEMGQRRLGEHRALLGEVGGRYGVDPRVIVALWGVESDYGRLTGDFPLVSALATLAHDGRRRAFFRHELIQLLRIVDLGYAELADLRGSWAGAMGQSQFMPSSFLAYAVDHDGDGRRDIWRSHADVFASIANYLARAGWRRDQSWGHQVHLPAGAAGQLAADPRTTRTLDAWHGLGVRRADGESLRDRRALAALVRPSGGPAFLVYDNYRVLLAWNRSTHFATAVGLIADRLQAPASREAPEPTPHREDGPDADAHAWSAARVPEPAPSGAVSPATGPAEGASDPRTAPGPRAPDRGAR